MVGYHSIPLVSGFLYDRGAYSALGFYPTGINDLGQIVGYVPNLPSSSFAHGVFDDHGVLTPLNVPGAVSTYVTGINNAGQIVGSYSTDELLRAYHGFLYSGGVFTTIEVPGASSGGVVGITDPGQLLLSASFASGGGGHFLATPSAVTAAPEPAAWALVGAGLLAIGGVVRRRPSAKRAGAQHDGCRRERPACGAG
jgi:probable HAF family extracellular repeat protein